MYVSMGGGRRHAHGEVQLLVDALHQRDKRPELLHFEAHLLHVGAHPLHLALERVHPARELVVAGGEARLGRNQCRAFGPLRLELHPQRRVGRHIRGALALDWLGANAGRRGGLASEQMLLVLGRIVRGQAAYSNLDKVHRAVGARDCDVAARVPLVVGGLLCEADVWRLLGIDSAKSRYFLGIVWP